MYQLGEDQMKGKRFLAIGLAVLLTAITVSAVLAGLTWCSSDPVFQVNGKELNVLVELAPAEVKSELSTDNPVKVVLQVPAESDASLVGFAGEFAEDVEIREGSNPGSFQVWLKAPHLRDLDRIRVTVTSGGVVLATDETQGRSLHVRGTLP
jgi:hypothetical protein